AEGGRGRERVVAPRGRVSGYRRRPERADEVSETVSDAKAADRPRKPPRVHGPGSTSSKITVSTPKKQPANTPTIATKKPVTPAPSLTPDNSQSPEDSPPTQPPARAGSPLPSPAHTHNPPPATPP